MTDEEKKAADEAAALQALLDNKVVETDVIAQKDAQIAKLEEERDNYKNVALKRLGKLPNDADFVAGDTGNGELTIAEQVRIILLDKEIESEKKAKEETYKLALRENSELKLALKNRPGTSIGGDSGTDAGTKDNVFSTEQIAALTRSALRIKADPEKFIAEAKKNLAARK